MHFLAFVDRNRLKAALNMDRHYASLELGGLPASRRRRHPISSKPSDFLDDGTPATPQGAMQTFGRAGPPEDDESADILRWKSGTNKVYSAAQNCSDQMGREDRKTFMSNEIRGVIRLAE